MALAQGIIRVAAQTHRGMVRDHNEDTIALGNVLLTGNMAAPIVAEIDHETRMLVVADGMGGHLAGELASRTALEWLRDRECPREVTGWCESLQEANDRLYDVMRDRPKVRGMGTTIVGVAFYAEELIYFNVGDSRAYRHGHGLLQQLSHDDVPEASDGAGRRVSSEITQSLGGLVVRRKITPHVAAAPPLVPGETILLCTDGLTDMINDRTISLILDADSDPMVTALRLVNAALVAGGHDNISVIVAVAF